ncbi:hypothetical protein P43SY_004725 [Pythium insidiosum]|uniref:M96 mating-specific protein family n=1 Tax=Pythium insidiosum TaxID=114742 RepID=A0AAD5LBW1_PYTIN|nr:hypothetical protein P43SY_004725 [Pythium insidiosum]
MGEAINSVATAMNMASGCSSSSNFGLDLFWSDALNLNLSGPEHDALCAAVSLVDEIVMEDGPDQSVFLDLDEDWGLDSTRNSPSYNKYACAGSPSSIEFLPFDEDDTLFPIEFDHVTEALLSALASVDELRLSGDGDALAFANDIQLSDDEAVRGGDLACPAAASMMALPGEVSGLPVISNENAGENENTSSATAKAKCVNRSRDRRRAEITYLREKVKELESRLSTMRRRAEQRETEAQTCDASPETAQCEASTTSLAPVWEEIALRQNELRRRAEEDNMKLKDMLEEQIRVAKSLERLIRKRSNVELLGLQQPAKRCRLRSHLDNPALFDDLLARVGELRLEADAVFNSRRFQGIDTRNPYRDAKILNGAASGTSVEVTELRLIPFPFGATADSSWLQFHIHAQESEDHVFEKIESSGDTVRIQFSARLFVQPFKAEYRTKLVARRFLEKDRQRIIWAALTEPQPGTDSVMGGVLMRHDGWHQLERVPEEELRRPGRFVTQVKTHHVIVPEPVEESSVNERKVGLLTDAVLNMVCVQLDMGQQMLENRLLERQLKIERVDEIAEPWDELSLDVETLDAALAYVDAYDDSLLSSTGDSSDSTPSATPPPPTPNDSEPPASGNRTKRNGNGSSSGGGGGSGTSSTTSRSRQKDEIQYLRGRVQELECKLAQLKRTAATNGDSDGAVTDRETDPETEVVRSSMWEAVAERQYAQRHLAEVENAKLRSMLEEQIKVAKALERLLRKRAVTELMTSQDTYKRTRITTSGGRVDDGTMFAKLTAPFEEMYLQTDELFAIPRFTSNTSGQVRHVDVRDEENLGTSVILYDQFVLPFEFSKTSKALWHITVTETHNFVQLLFEDVDMTDDTMLKKVRVVIDHPSIRLPLMDPEQIADTPMEGVTMRQKGWTVITPASRRLCPPGVEDATVVQMHHVATAELGGDIENPKRKVGTLTNFLLRTTDFHLDSGRQMVENFMLDGSWKQLVEDS